jgi:holo-[acyl-carrier protein] synthase
MQNATSLGLYIGKAVLCHIHGIFPLYVKNMYFSNLIEDNRMIFGIGTDIIEVSRVGGLVSQSDGFKEGIFTRGEIEYCESKRFKNQHYAARFAAKEAFLKALGTGWAQGISFAQVDVYNDDLGKPEIRLSGKAEEFAREKGINNIYVSITHLKDYAVAMVVLETL